MDFSESWCFGCIGVWCSGVGPGGGGEPEDGRRDGRMGRWMGGQEYWRRMRGWEVGEDGEDGRLGGWEDGCEDGMMGGGVPGWEGGRKDGSIGRGWGACGG